MYKLRRSKFDKKLTITIPYEILPDLKELAFEFDGIDGTYEEFATYALTVFVLNHSRNAGIDPDFDETRSKRNKA